MFVCRYENVDVIQFALRLRWFSHVERMDERRLTIEIYKADLGGNAGRRRPRRTFLGRIGEVLEKGQVKRIRNRKDRSKWKEVISAYPNGKRA
jgi:hypothetical protein